jgi:hypothetical protein
VTSTTQLRGEMENSSAGGVLWKYVNATARDPYRVMRAGVVDDEGRTKALFS